MENIFDGRDWKYLIAFDNDMYKNIVHHSFSYLPKEREILSAQIQFYRKNFTFEQVLKSFRKLKSEDDIKEFKAAVIKRENHIMFCPKELKQYYYDVVKKEYSEHSEFLLGLLNIANEKKCDKNPLIPLYKKIMGVYFAPVKRKVSRYNRKPLPMYTPSYDFNEEKVKDLIKSTIRATHAENKQSSVWGPYDIGRLRLYFNHDYGTGKHISKHFYMGAEDAYIIKTNERHASLDEIKHAFYRNIYPGRAHLFNTLIPSREFNFDAGADYIVNGWSAFSAWHIYPSDYTAYSKVFNSKIMYHMLHGNWQKGLTDIYLFMLGNVDKYTAIKQLIEITQYPGRFESFVLGGLCTEMLIKKKFATNPMGLLDEYKKRNVADFFALFKPNTNKC